MVSLFNIVEKAQADVNIGTIKPIEPSGSDLLTLLSRVVNDALYFAAVLAFIYLIYGGITYITSGGDSAKADKGRASITNAIIGIVVILVALAIVNYVTKTVG